MLNARDPRAVECTGESCRGLRLQSVQRVEPLVHQFVRERIPVPVSPNDQTRRDCCTPRTSPAVPVKGLIRAESFNMRIGIGTFHIPCDHMTSESLDPPVSNRPQETEHQREDSLPPQPAVPRSRMVRRRATKPVLRPRDCSHQDPSADEATSAVAIISQTCSGAGDGLLERH